MAFMRHLLATLAIFTVLVKSEGVKTSTKAVTAYEDQWDSDIYTINTLSPLLAPPRPPRCPPCFNCQLPAFKCGNYGTCSEFDGQCKCPEGWGGIDCLTPQCGSLAGGEHRLPRAPGKECECDEGWSGINCNVCETDQACSNFPLGMLGPSRLDVADDVPLNMTCFKGGQPVNKPHQMCDVTNPKILDLLGERLPQVTFSCDNSKRECSFQFWIGQVESFYCALDECEASYEYGYNKNTTAQDCKNIKCSCIKDRMLCGEDGSVDITDFLADEIRGPAKFSCQTGSGCKFEEPAMNDLILMMFGDSYITLTCNSGECLYYTQVPGYTPPPKPDNTLWIALSSAAAVTLFLASVALVWYGGRINSSEGFNAIRLPEEEAAHLMNDHVPAQLQFRDLSYSLPNHIILDKVVGSVKPGQVMAIMGASGAGKSTLLDLLARRHKRGVVTGETLVNGREVDNSTYKKVIGYVDQEDTLMPTLTVYETVLYSALLRLPREMSYEAKKFRTLETLNELGILGIKDSRIGESGKRSISGGEKRRVSIACELVTSPSILFLDEPTSGLDAFNAYNVVESLVSLARDYHRTVIFTIHQPRSNIVSMFDQLVLLAKGRVVYSGEYSKCQSYFESIGYNCPPGFNIADYLIDLTSSKEILDSATPHSETSLDAAHTAEPSAQGGHASSSSSRHEQPDQPETISGESPAPATPKQSLLEQGVAFFKRSTQGGDNASSSSTRANHRTKPVPLDHLFEAFDTSDAAKNLRADINQASGEHLRDVAEESTVLRGRNRASWGTQFRILSGRAFKNLYRDPALLTTHYAASIIVAIVIGLLDYHVTNDMPGFQNRLGFIFFTLAMFGFSCLTTLGLFANERILYMRERANGYYSSFTYFTSKVLFDILPLRVVPPLVYGVIVYGMVGLVPNLTEFWRFLMVLVLFNLTAASVVLFISVAIANTSVAALLGNFVMLYNLLFAGLLINRDTLGTYIEWLHATSFFHAAYEALLVNELRTLTLKEVRFGLTVEVPAATILSIFGLRADAFWWPDVVTLCVMFVSFMVLSYLTLHFWVKERR